MEKESRRDPEQYRSPHGWLIMFLILMTMGVFLLVVLTATASPSPCQSLLCMSLNKDEPSTIKKSTMPPALLAPMAMTTAPPMTTTGVMKRLLIDGKTADHSSIIRLMNEELRRHFSSLPPNLPLQPSSSLQQPSSLQPVAAAVGLDLGGKRVTRISVGKNFYIYDCKIIHRPSNPYLEATLLIDLPSIEINFSTIYAKYYPLINPYIHVVELHYRWGFTDGIMDSIMSLESIRLYMVDWSMNRYRNMYIHTKNSPMCFSDMPEPIPFTQEQLHQFLLQSHLFATLPISSPNSLIAQSVQDLNPKSPL